MNRRCLWTDWNLQKLADHDVTPEEFEAAIANPLREVVSQSSGRPAVFGLVRGRLLFCVYDEIDADTILPRTACEVEE
ncbi:MAG: hypothetical protein ACK5Q5_15155 [Planctomycetaceae bacterium]